MGIIVCKRLPHCNTLWSSQLDLAGEFSPTFNYVTTLQCMVCYSSSESATRICAAIAILSLPLRAVQAFQPCSNRESKMPHAFIRSTFGHINYCLFSGCMMRLFRISCDTCAGALQVRMLRGSVQTQVVKPQLLQIHLISLPVGIPW